MDANDREFLAELVERLRTTLAEEITSVALSVEQSGRWITKELHCGELPELGDGGPGGAGLEMVACKIYCTLLQPAIPYLARDMLSDAQAAMLVVLARRAWELAQLFRNAAPIDQLGTPPAEKGGGDGAA